MPSGATPQERNPEEVARLAIDFLPRRELTNRIVAISTTQTSVTGAVEEIIYIYTIPANSLAIDGRSGIRIRAWGKQKDNGTSQQIKIRLGGIAGTIVAQTTASGYAAGQTDWVLDATILRKTSITQTAEGQAHVTTSAPVALVSSPGATLTGNVDLVVTGDGAVANDITIHGAVVEMIQI